MKNYRKLFTISLLFIVFGCFDYHEDSFIRYGTFKIIHDDSSVTFILRDSIYQYKYSPNHPERNKFSRIRWINKKEYTEEVLSKKTSFDSLLFHSKIDDVIENRYFETTFIKGTQLKFSSEVIKISDTINRITINQQIAAVLQNNPNER